MAEKNYTKMDEYRAQIKIWIYFNFSYPMIEFQFEPVKLF